MELDRSYAWSTHRPLLQSLVSTLKPKYILELGMGVHSTPIFIEEIGVWYCSIRGAK